ncbi:MAG: BREX-1 system adenine-specific DNA-methyltransferase PglX [Alkalispirochaeta sp.]
MTALSDRAKGRLRSTVQSVRTRLLEDLRRATEQRFALGALKREAIRLFPDDQLAWEIVNQWLADPARTHAVREDNLAALIKERAYTLVNRLVLLMQMEVRGLRTVRLVADGVENSAFRTYREFFSDLAAADDGGFGYLLQQVWDELARELPALFAYNEVHEAIPVPGPTLLWLIDTLADAELRDAWRDDTTLGWLYQYWNDPDRKAIDDKIRDGGKVESHELAQKTQLFTERYMVEWLVQNSVGAQWLAICRKNGWQPTATATLGRLQEKRESWDRPDEAIPIEGDEEWWKFYVEQELTEETVATAPDRLDEVRILDPAMGSGHFLVYLFDYFYHLYGEEAQHTGEAFSPQGTIDAILTHNLHGVDLDNRAVQIAAASLYIKTQEHLPGYRLRALNVVATDLGLAHIGKNDPAVREFAATLEREAGLKSQVSLQIIEALKGADYLGSLLRIDEEIRKIGEVYGERGGTQQMVASIMEALGAFIRRHDRGEDLGLRSLADQLGKGLRLIEILGRKYDVVVANPPYAAIAKMDEKLGESLSREDVLGDGDIFALFFLLYERRLRRYGTWATIAQHNWMFLGSYREFREHILSENGVAAVAHLGSGAFQEIGGVVVGSAMVVAVKGTAKCEGAYQRSVAPIGAPAKRIHLLNGSKVSRFPQSRFAEIEGSPMIYWWPEEFRTAYVKAKKLRDVAEVRQGLATSNDARFLRTVREVRMSKIGLAQGAANTARGKTWFPFVKGAAGRRWVDDVEYLITWKDNGKEVKSYASYLYRSATRTIKNQSYYFRQGLAFNGTGTNDFISRLRKYQSIFGHQGSTIFASDYESLQVILSTSFSGYVAQSINPTIVNEVGDIAKLPVLDYLTDYRPYLERARSLYDRLFASSESNIEYRYEHLPPEEFEVEEARIRDDIDREIFAHFSPETVTAIREEIGLSPFDYPPWDGETIPDGFADAYQQAEGILELAHRYRIHPDGILAIAARAGKVHENRRQAEAFTHLSWAIGVLLGRFDPQTGGLVDLAPEPDTSRMHPHGLVYLSSLDEIDGFPRPSGFNIGTAAITHLLETLRERWGAERTAEICEEIADALVRGEGQASVAAWIRLKAFDRHKDIYQKRPIYFPLVSAKKNFFVWINIHRWNEGTLTAVLANYLKEDQRQIDSRLRRLREDIQRTNDKRTRNTLETEVAELAKLQEELDAFVARVATVAEKGPNPGAQEVEAPYVMDLDDGVMVNSAALWDLVNPLWKDPKKWWASLATPKGKKDFDWSHLAMRYWPERVFAKCKKDPSLAVAHSDYGQYAGRDLFEELHPEAAKKWREQGSGSGAGSGSAGEEPFLGDELDFGE